jgi:CelD/BcsL family acetyltransferase involved in cellulose biosynthesis
MNDNTPLQLRVINSRKELVRELANWTKLLDQVEDGDLFSHPLWHLSWWESFGSRCTMVLLVAQRGENWVGILPLAMYRSIRHGFGSILEFSGSTQGDRHNLVCLPGHSIEVLDLFAEPVQALLKKVDLVHLTAIPIGSPLLSWHVLMDHAPQLLDQVAPFLEMRPGVAYEDLEASWKKSHRIDVRRQSKRLGKIGPLHLEVITDESEAKAVLNEFLANHTKRWFSRDLFIYIHNKRTEYFLERLIQRMLSNGKLHFSMLRAGEKTVSYHLGFFYNDRLYYYKPVFVQAFQNLSPGKVHIAKLLEAGCTDQWRIFDFLSGDEKYKYQWANNTESLHTIQIPIWRNIPARLANKFLTSLRLRIRNARMG